MEADHRRHAEILERKTFLGSFIRRIDDSFHTRLTRRSPPSPPPRVVNFPLVGFQSPHPIKSIAIKAAPSVHPHQAGGRDRVHDADPCRRWVNQDDRSTVCQESWLRRQDSNLRPIG